MNIYLSAKDKAHDRQRETKTQKYIATRKEIRAHAVNVNDKPTLPQP